MGLYHHVDGSGFYGYPYLFVPHANVFGIAQPEVAAWCDDRFGPIVDGCGRTRMGPWFMFKDETQALEFKLRWC